jgi:ribosomal protein S27AE
MILCKICKQEKGLSEFYASRKATCKECVKLSVRNNRLKRIEYYRAYDRARGSRQPKSYLVEYRERFPNKYRAHNKLNNALRDGKIRKEPCEKCGKRKSVAHHDDYLKPLDVRWLCQAHHKQWHAKYGEGKNP